MSASNFVAPYKFIGELALSVDKEINCSTLLSIQLSTTFCVPKTLVFIVSKGLYSLDGTCLKAAACMTMSTSLNAIFSLDLSLISPKKNLNLLKFGVLI